WPDQRARLAAVARRTAGFGREIISPRRRRERREMQSLQNLLSLVILSAVVRFACESLCAAEGPACTTGNARSLDSRSLSRKAGSVGARDDSARRILRVLSSFHFPPVKL